ncbi:hypothetical protein [Streptomyces sp. H27-D2]|uniref:hypothetical protein n=1 Tax=Streptomyces sp. H27-D2 TaxID=3046304 RepID=UPI002DB697C8|nr:hypothetical protein [Streptomyces sp. H27-D2]MEC4016788.1 hypothetical protein [Streptomyces sp. H27-D2]
MKREVARERENVAAALGERLRAADEEMQTPPGLWADIRTSAAVRSGVRPAARPSSRRAPRLALVALTAVIAVGAVMFGTWWLLRPSGTGPGPASDTDPGPSAPDSRVTLSVHNVESACRKLRTTECALRLAKNPYARYAAPDNSAGHVWHGDRLSAICVVTDGTLVRDEQGITSTRWYLVEQKSGVEGWLPGVRTRNTTEVRTCSPGEVDATPSR